MWQYDMSGHIRKIVEKYCEVAKISKDKLRPVKTPCIDDHEISPDELEEKGVLAPIASSLVLQILYPARMIRCDLYYAVNVLCREVAKWTKACDRRLFRLICYMNQTADLCIISFVGDRLEDMRLALYADASFADCLKTSKSSTGGFLCLVGPRSFVPLTWLCKKQHAVSHSSTESEILRTGHLHQA